MISYALESFILLILVPKMFVGLWSLAYLRLTAPESLLRGYLYLRVTFLPFIWLLAVLNILFRIVFK
jgi:hypothetical protein